MFRGARQHSLERGCTFELSLDWIKEKLTIGVCEATGVSFEFGPPEVGKKYNWLAPSLDRKDSTGGYTIDNVWVTTWRYNACKSDVSVSEFVEFCRLVYQNSLFSIIEL